MKMKKKWKFGKSFYWRERQKAQRQPPLPSVSRYILQLPLIVKKILYHLNNYCAEIFLTCNKNPNQKPFQLFTKPLSFYRLFNFEISGRERLIYMYHPPFFFTDNKVV